MRMAFRTGQTSDQSNWASGVALFSQLLGEYFGFAELQKMRNIWLVDSPSSGFQQI